MHLSQFLETYVSDWSGLSFDVKAIGSFEYNTDVQPKTYIDYAQSDLESKLDHRYINALSNAKRAIDCQADNIFVAFNIRKPRNFPEKLRLIGDLGLIAPRIVRKVVKVRNLLEHEYYSPSQAEVEDAVDVALLFVEATSRPFRTFMDDYFVAESSSVQELTHEKIVSSLQNDEDAIKGYTYTKSFYVCFEQDSCTFWIDCVHDNNLVEEIEINPKHPFFMRMIRFSFDYDLDHNKYSEQEIGDSFVSLMKDLAKEL